MFQTLQNESILLIGERVTTNKIIWVQLFNASTDLKEEEQRKIMFEIKTQILKNRIKSGSFRKFLDAKLLYYEIDRTPSEKTRNKIICLYTNQKDKSIEIKKSVEIVAYRGGAFGVYSASRFFSEMIDLLLSPHRLNYQPIRLENALELVDQIDGQNMNINEIGQLISLINRSLDMDRETLEKLYFVVYERITSLDQIPTDEDPDEFLDASYLIARRYVETDNFYLALELFKKIIPIASKNHRFDLETLCRIRIATIYKDYFPEAGQYILDALQPIKSKKHLSETSKPNIEIYYCLLGFAYSGLNKKELALKYYKKGVLLAEGSTGSPDWIAGAYSQLGEDSMINYYFSDASRQFLTAATIAFSGGLLRSAEDYRDKAAIAELNTSYSYVHTAIVNRMEGSIDQAEYRAWDALRTLLKAYLHIKPQNVRLVNSKSTEILNESEKVLDIKGRRRQAKAIITKIRNKIIEIDDLSIDQSFSINDVKLDKLIREIDNKIPIPPPTFMLLALDGRLILMGEVHSDGWRESSIEGAILSGILSAIMSLITEVSDKQSSLRTIDAGAFQIMLEQSDNVVSVLVVDRDLPEFRNNLISILNHINDEFGGFLRYWNGHGEPKMIKHIVRIILNQFSIS